jgi:hypothetical protein
MGVVRGSGWLQRSFAHEVWPLSPLEPFVMFAMVCETMYERRTRLVALVGFVECSGYLRDSNVFFEQGSRPRLGSSPRVPSVSAVD